jgi:hypothetical protein
MFGELFVAAIPYIVPFMLTSVFPEPGPFTEAIKGSYWPVGSVTPFVVMKRGGTMIDVSMVKEGRKCLASSLDLLSPLPFSLGREV